MKKRIVIDEEVFEEVYGCAHDWIGEYGYFGDQERNRLTWDRIESFKLAWEEGETTCANFHCVLPGTHSGDCVNSDGLRCGGFVDVAKLGPTDSAGCVVHQLNEVSEDE